MRITKSMLNEKITYANEMLDTTITNRNFNGYNHLMIDGENVFAGSNGDNNGYIERRIKMATPKLKPKEKPEIKRIETDYKSIKALRNFICGIDFIFLGVISIALQNGVETTDGTAAIMLFVMGLAAIFNRD